MNNEKKEKDMLKDAYSQIKAPEDWKKEILQKMQAENETLQKNEKIGQKENLTIHEGKHKGIRLRAFAAAGAAICAAAVLIFVLLPKQAVYVTPMEPGEFYESIELKDGIINFKKERTVISVSPNAGQIGEAASIEDKEDSTAQVLDSEVPADGGMLTLRQADNPMVKTIADEDWSYIGKQKVYVSVSKAKEQMYRAFYEKNEMAYEVTGAGVTQKAFIDYLYRQIKK